MLYLPEESGRCKMRIGIISWVFPATYYKGFGYFSLQSAEGIYTGCVRYRWQQFSFR